MRHLANTPALLTRPDTWFDLVRPGGGVTGLCTSPGGPPGWLRPAMTVRTHLVQVKRVAPGTGVSYGHRYVTAGNALGLVPLGYHEGIPRAGANTVQVLVRGSRLTISGTVCMNQCVVDAGDLPIEAGRRGHPLRRWRQRRADRAGVGRRAGHALLRHRDQVYGEDPEKLLWSNRRGVPPAGLAAGGTPDADDPQGAPLVGQEV